MLAGNELFSDQSAAAAFMADRVELTKGSTELSIDLAIAMPHWLLHMRRLDTQLSSCEFLMEKPTFWISLRIIVVGLSTKTMC